jgi:hypothetical protein
MPPLRSRTVYAAMATSASTGAARDITLVAHPDQ